jgi:hypothetical protein
MSAWNIVWTGTIIVFPILLGAIPSALGMNPPKFIFSRVCLWLSAVLLAGTGTAWAVQPEHSLFWRITVGGLLWVAIGIGMPKGLQWIPEVEKDYIGRTPVAPEHGPVITQTEKPARSQL